MPLSTSVKSITGWPAASCIRTMSRPLMLHAAMSLVNGSAALQAGSSSSLKPCGEASLFIVTTQVLLRSVVESSHCPIMSFFRLEASCDRAGGGSARGAAGDDDDQCVHRLRHLDQVGVMLVGNISCGLARVIDHRHARGFQAAADRLADAAHADDADLAVAQRTDAQRIVMGLPETGAQIPVGLDELAQRRKQQSHRDV